MKKENIKIGISVFNTIIRAIYVDNEGSVPLN